MIQQESGLKRQVIDVGNIKILVGDVRVLIEGGELLEFDIQVNRHNRRKVVGGQLVCFHIVIDTQFVHAVFRD